MGLGGVKWGVSATCALAAAVRTIQKQSWRSRLSLCPSLSDDKPTHIKASEVNNVVVAAARSTPAHTSQESSIVCVCGWGRRRHGRQNGWKKTTTNGRRRWWWQAAVAERVGLGTHTHIRTHTHTRHRRAPFLSNVSDGVRVCAENKQSMQAHPVSPRRARQFFEGRSKQVPKQNTIDLWPLSPCPTSFIDQLDRFAFGLTGGWRRASPTLLYKKERVGRRRPLPAKRLLPKLCPVCNQNHHTHTRAHAGEARRRCRAESCCRALSLSLSLSLSPQSIVVPSEK